MSASRGPGGGDEVDGDHVGTLVQELEERVLRVGARLAPDDRAGGGGGGLAVLRDALAVRFHFELLDIGGETLEPLVVGDQRHGWPAHRVAPPDAGKREQHWQVLFKGRLAEMPVHRGGPGEKGPEPPGADGNGQAQPDRTPERVAPADPVPEAEDPLRGDAELGAGREIGRDRRHVVWCVTAQPGPGGAGIGHRLQRREGF